MASSACGIPPTAGFVRALFSNGSQGSRERFSLSADGKRMVTVERSHEANFRLWDFETGRKLSRVPVPNPKPYLSLMTYSPRSKDRGNGLVRRRDRVPRRGDAGRGRSDEGRIREHPPDRILAGRPAAGWDESGALGTHRRRADRRVRGGRRSAASHSIDSFDPERASLVIWDVAQAAETQRIDVQGCHPIAWCSRPMAQSLVAPFCDGTIRFFDAASGHERFRLRLDGPGQRTIAISPDGSTLWLPAMTRRGYRHRQSTSGTWPESERRTGWPSLTILTDSRSRPMGRLSPWAQWEKVLRLWDLATGREIDPKPSHRNSVACLVVSPGGKTVITGGYDNAIRQWDAVTGRELSVIGMHADPVYDLAISPDGRIPDLVQHRGTGGWPH